MFDPPISAGANIFIIIAVCIIAFGAAITIVDVYKSSMLKKRKDNKQ